MLTGGLLRRCSSDIDDLLRLGIVALLVLSLLLVPYLALVHLVTTLASLVALDLVL
jgi:hypothetical protein